MSADPRRIAGFEEANKILKEVADSMDPLVRDALNYVANLAVQKMKEKAPIDTGFLKGSIHATQPIGNHVKVISEAPYSGFVNYGHRTRGSTSVPANPYFSSVVEEIQGNILLKNKVDNILYKRVKDGVNSQIRASISKYRPELV